MSISARMIDIAKYLFQYHQTTYKEISQSLGIKERNVRYDIDKINDLLIDNGLSPILKQSKGSLQTAKDFSLSIFDSRGDSFFIFSQKERVSIIELYLLFNYDKFKLSEISAVLQVSRSTIKSDLEEAENRLADAGIKVIYNNGFKIYADRKKRGRFMSKVLKKYTMNIKNFHRADKFNEFVMKIINESFYGISLEKVIYLIDEFLDKSNHILSDDTYNWYISCILCMIWMYRHDEIPLYQSSFLNRKLEILSPFLNQLEDVLGEKLSKETRDRMTAFIGYIDLYAMEDTNQEIANIEEIVTNLVAGMSLETGVPFQNDLILIEGLFHHIIPLIQRMQLGVVVEENVVSLLSTSNLEIYEMVIRVISNIDRLKYITNENEIAYLTIHFIASLKRLKQTKRKRILLICGHGYGTTTMLKETLLDEYQVEIIDTIPRYKLSNYKSKTNIDLIITTMKLETNINYLQVNPILTELDERHLIEAGVTKRTALSDYYALNNSLNFLTDEDRLKVLEVVRRELGYKELSKPKKISRLSDLLTVHEIRVTDEDMTWEDAVIKSCEILENNNAINRNYMESIFETIEQNGFYSVLDKSFALFHGNSEKGVFKTGMSMIINKKPIKFEDKTVNIIFCLSSLDQKEHIPAIIYLMKLQKTTEFINHIKLVNSPVEAINLLHRYEERVA